jgi:hypothetical protein
MKRRVVGLVVLMIAFGVGYARSVQRSDGYLHDEPCCFGDMGMPGFTCWHSTQFAGSGAVRAEQSLRVANVNTVRQH